MASSIKLHPRTGSAESLPPNPLPKLIQTPSGLAMLELQGTINLPQTPDSDATEQGDGLQIGRITFPDYHPEVQEAASTVWMKRVHLYVGRHQRLTGEVKKLPRAIAIIRRRLKSGQDLDMESSTDTEDKGTEELEVVDIVKYKLVFSHRPEPVGTT
ncbi:hypothetical protein GGR57DRAFT_360914 [Xylariaceae sp. FL1272]|nr:hypothetical protein GGR57DRAFT_360914 [Xylariaceae sp. FL1272]